ncbi:hypothetical protein C8Q74DRAFT_1264919 [Fomes fomentarius]|nr:hypothetical protein C8Q74DRAFT_1264919 [Fomes fomentarius]
MSTAANFRWDSVSPVFFCLLFARVSASGTGKRSSRTSLPRRSALTSDCPSSKSAPDWDPREDLDATRLPNLRLFDSILVQALVLDVLPVSSACWTWGRSTPLSPRSCRSTPGDTVDRAVFDEKTRRRED